MISSQDAGLETDRLCQMFSLRVGLARGSVVAGVDKGLAAEALAPLDIE